MVRKRQQQLALVCGAALVVTLLSSTSCTPTRNYAIPEKVCDVTTDTALTEYILPPGEEITQSMEEYGAENRLLACNVRVDSTVYISVRGEWRESDATALQVAQDRHPHAEQSRDDTFATWPGGVATVFECRNTKKESEFFSLITTVRKDDQDDFASTADKFARDLTKKLMAKQPCEEG
ncbi:hypothetical protein [Streptomyces sparsus]